MCLDGGDSNNVHMVLCQEGNANQHFTYDASTHHIKNGDKCLDYDPGSTNVYTNSNCESTPNQVSADNLSNWSK